MREQHNRLISPMKEYGWSWAWIRVGSGRFHFRIFGYGLAAMNWKKNRLSFSDRNFAAVGKPMWIFGYWVVKGFKPNEF